MRVTRISTLPTFLLLLLLAVAILPAAAQRCSKNIDPVNGYDPLLYNGKVYSFHPMPGTVGTQYLFDSFDSLGSITVRGVTYTNLTLNFDIYHQSLILKFKNGLGSQSLIEISYAWLEEASIWGGKFETYKKPGSAKRLYQVLGTGKEKIMYSLRKELLLDNMKSSGNHYFSSVKKDIFVLTGEHLFPIKSNASFIKSFSLTKQSYIKTYLRLHKIKITKANDFRMAELINYCNSLPE